ncbi:MAG: MlaD family protein [Candidatus Omnitrophica bacterium]|nr:MlaD family protein [Candidatus Omnitrophota bacterium]
MKINNEIKTGIIVVAAILVVALFYAKTAGTSSGKTYRIKTYFNYAEGVKQDAIVKLAGIEVGRVEKIQFQYMPETKIEMVMAISDKARIHEDSIAFIATSGMIGDAYLGITPGTADKPSVHEGGIIASEDPVEARKLWKKSDAIADNLDKMLIEVKGLTENVNGVMKDNKARIDGIAVNLEQTAVNFKDFSSDIKQHPWKLLMKGKE